MLASTCPADSAASAGEGTHLHTPEQKTGSSGCSTDAVLDTTMYQRALFLSRRLSLSLLLRYAANQILGMEGWQVCCQEPQLHLPLMRAMPLLSLFQDAFPWCLLFNLRCGSHCNMGIWTVCACRLFCHCTPQPACLHRRASRHRRGALTPTRSPDCTASVRSQEQPTVLRRGGGN